MPRSRATHPELWRAVVARSSDADRRFVYAVRTTGIYCRPGCPSRRPNPDNVEFFESPGAALLAGYRACKRCRPAADGPGDSTLEAVTSACRLLRSAQSMHNRDVAAAVGLSESYFQRAFKKHLGVTPQQYRRRVLAERGREALAQGGSVTASVYEAGYSSSSRFYEGLGKELGMRPSAAKAGAEGEVIRYAIAKCSIGHLMVAWTSRGACEVGIADTPEPLATGLREHFPRARLVASDPIPWVDAVIEGVETSSPVELPLDIRGTAFQERVWQQLRAIPMGETRTYSEIAAALGQPSASRAVARACAQNRLAVVVPCHRVVRKDGTVSGYRWGPQKKRDLLHREAAKNEPS